MAGAEAQLRHLAREPFMLMSAIVQPFFIAATIMFMYRNRPDFDPVFVVVGSALAGLWTVALFEGNWSIGRERWQGTLEIVAAAPSPLELVIAGRMIGSMVFALISVAVSWLTGALLFGYEITVRDPAGFAISLVLGLASLWTMAMLFAPLGILSPAASYFLNIVEYPVYILAGFVFPILLLPFWTTPISYALPPYWAAQALHATSSGAASGTDVTFAWAMLVVTGVVLLAITQRLYRHVLFRARVEGTLGLA